MKRRSTTATTTTTTTTVAVPPDEEDVLVVDAAAAGAFAVADVADVAVAVAVAGAGAGAGGAASRRRTGASLGIRAQEEVASMLEDMDSWRRGPAVRNFLQLYLELLDTFLMNAAVQAKVVFMPEDMDS